MSISKKEIKQLDSYFRCANYLSVGQLYLLDNPLLKEELKWSDVKKKIVGHWGTVPGQNFIYTHLNRVIKNNDLNMIYISGPGHGGNALISNVYIEGTYSNTYKDITEDYDGLKKLFKQFSFPGGVSSHVAPTVPGSINEGGELGYSLLHAFGAVFDNPDLIAACVIGDGEAETGPLATSWHSNKFLNPKTDGAVLPILHLNGYKISNPTILARISDDELSSLLWGYGWKPYLVCGSNTYELHKSMANTLDTIIKEIKKIQESIDTLKSFNREKSIKRAESKEKQLAKIERIDRPENLPSAITVQFTPAIESGYDVLKVTDLSMRYDQMVFEHCNLDIKKGERVAIVGENGVGKTTLFKALVGQLPIDHGKIRFGSHVEMAYYDQEHESLNYNKTIFDEISDCYPRMTNQEIRSTLAMFNFRGDDVFKDIAMLSGGERGRVVLTEVLLKQANFLILDEPTNHLDISSKEVLEEALKSFEGTILFISHDRYFINKIATRVIEVQKDQCLSYNGNYDDYLNQKTPVVETTQKIVTEAKQRQIIDKKTKNEIKKLERTIDSLEKEINSLKEELTSEEVMNNYKKYNEITDSIEEKEMELMVTMEKWEQLQA